LKVAFLQDYLVSMVVIWIIMSLLKDLPFIYQLMQQVHILAWVMFMLHWEMEGFLERVPKFKETCKQEALSLELRHSHVQWSKLAIVGIQLRFTKIHKVQ